MRKPPPPQPDLAFLLAKALLGHVIDRINAAGYPVAKSFISDGDTIPADDCCDGIAWTRVGALQTTDGSGDQIRDLLPAVTPMPGHGIVLEVGILRCSPAGPGIDEQGDPPAAADITSAALLAAQDRQFMRLAVECDLPKDIIKFQADGHIPGAWGPISAGGCVGGFMTTTVVATIVI